MGVLSCSNHIIFIMKTMSEFFYKKCTSSSDELECAAKDLIKEAQAQRKEDVRAAKDEATKKRAVIRVARAIDMAETALIRQDEQKQTVRVALINHKQKQSSNELYQQLTNVSVDVVEAKSVTERWLRARQVTVFFV